MGAPKREVLDLLAFRREAAEALCKADTSAKQPQSRPSIESLLNYVPELDQKKATSALMPTAAVRFNG